MNKVIFTASLVLLAFVADAQIKFKQLKQKAAIIKTDSSIKKMIAPVASSSSHELSNEEIIAGLKEALNVGAKNSSVSLSALDGFYKNEAIKIMMPAETEKIVNTMRQLGMGRLVDDAVESMNRAAEDATSNVGSIFSDAIRDITIKDGISILRGGNHAATDYLRSKTTDSLTVTFRPVVEVALQKVNATKYWKDFASAYNRLSAKKVNPDLTAYVVEKTLNGLFFTIGQEETKIRKDPAARVTEVLKKVFE